MISWSRIQHFECAKVHRTQNVLGDIAHPHENIEFALRTTMTMDDNENGNGADGKTTIPMDDDNQSTTTETTENTKGSKERKCRDCLMAMKINHHAQRQQKSFAETVQELVGHGIREFENDLQFLDKKNERITDANADKEWRNKEFHKKIDVHEVRSANAAVDTIVMKIRSRHSINEIKKTFEISEMLRSNEGLVVANHEDTVEECDLVTVGFFF